MMAPMITHLHLLSGKELLTEGVDDEMSVFNITPSPLTASTRSFLIPPTILSDYENYLMTEVPNAVFDFQVLHNWYDKDDATKEPYMLRAEYFPINWKSKVGNSDMNRNFYTNTHESIRKGDIAIKEDGELLMLNWDIQVYINAKTTQAINCNHIVEISRHVPAKADRRGYVITEAHDETIVNSIPCVMSEYAGRPDYMIAQNSPGIHSDMLTVCDIQYNESTKDIMIDDFFTYANYTYHVIHIDHTQVMYAEPNNVYGIIRLYCRQVAGEDL